jgi:drug/metabolite transporter (DMT)-like permease
VSCRPLGNRTYYADRSVFLVLGAALVHATWNALVKADGDRLSLIELMSGTQILVSLCLIPFVAVPAADSWPFLLASSGLNTSYMFMLNRAYQAGDLSLVYPVARGLAPVVVAIVSTVALGQALSYANQMAVLLIALGITSLALSGKPRSLIDLRPLILAVATAVFIGSYTIVDGLGARVAGSAHAYVVWLSLVTSIVIVACTRWLRRGRREPIRSRTRNAGIAAGLMSYGSAWVVIWALTLAPFAVVSALRETSVVFAVLIGVVVLKERLSLARLASIGTTLIGTTVLKLGR